jgi:sensor histidine kinase regulating citrate/malate metabolism
MYGLLESMDDGVMAWNEQGVLQFLNAQAALLLHLDAPARGKHSRSARSPCCCAGRSNMPAA